MNVSLKPYLLSMARLLHVAHLQVGGRVAQALARDCAAALRAAERRRAGVVAEAVEREAGAVLQLPAAARQRRAVGLPLLRARAPAPSATDLVDLAWQRRAISLPLLRARARRLPSATNLVDPASGMPGVRSGAYVHLACPSCARARRRRQPVPSRSGARHACCQSRCTCAAPTPFAALACRRAAPCDSCHCLH